MSKIIEETTGSRSFLVCDRADAIIFYRTGTEIAIWHKKEQRLELRRPKDEVMEFTYLLTEFLFHLDNERATTER